MYAAAPPSKTLPMPVRPETAASGPDASAWRPLSLKRNVTWTAAGSAVEMLSHWGRVVVLTQLGSLDMLGMVVLAFALCGPVNALACLGLRGAVVTDARREYGFGDYLALRLATATLALLVIVGLVVAAGHRGPMAAIVLLVAAGEWLKSVSDVFHALLQQHERMDRVALSLAIRGLLALGFLTLGVALTGSVVWAMAGFPLAMGVTLLAWDLCNGARVLGAGPASQGAARAALRPRWHLPTMLRLCWLTLPLGVVMMLLALQASVPRWLVSHYLGHRELGIFVSIFYLVMIGSRAVGALAQSAGPRLAKHYAAGNARAFGWLVMRLLGIVAAVGIGVILTVALAGGPILRLLYGLDYTPYLRTAVWLMAAGALMYLSVPLGMATDAMRRFKTHMLIRGAGVGALAALLPGLIAGWGLLGAAWGLAIGFALMAATYAAVVGWEVRRLYGRNEHPSHGRPPECRSRLESCTW